MASQTDLVDQIEWRSLECLNAHPDHAVNNALKQGYREDDGLYLESDTDEQLLLHVPFQTAVKLQSITVKSTKDKGRAPKRIRLFVNSPNIGFGEADDTPATQELELSEAALEGSPVPLKIFCKAEPTWSPIRARELIVKFQRVNVLSIFVASNRGDEETTIVQKLAFSGTSGQTFNVSEIKKVGEEDK